MSEDLVQHGGPVEMKTCVDRGGTFTDVVRWGPDGSLTIQKVPSDRAVIGELAQGDLRFGTTVATNALLERTGRRTLLLVTEGLGDLPTIRDQRRPDLFQLDEVWPEPLCAGVLEVRGRIDAEGAEVEPLIVPDALETILEEGSYEAVAIALMNSHRNPAHEEALASHIPEGIFTALGHLASPELGYLSRIDTTLVDAAISPVLLEALERDQVAPEALAMRSDGSLCPAPELRAPDAVLSGPAGGVLAVAAVAAQAGFERAVGLDMGGTSTDVCRVDVGQLPRRLGDVAVAGVNLRRPMLEVETIAAGGGSVLGHDGRQLTLGPRSAGADPGPQCYGRGGPPTLTDAALSAGRVEPGSFDPPLRADLVELPGEADAYLLLAEERMAQAVRRLAMQQGVDLRDHALVSYGGAAGQYAAGVAERLEISTVLVHPCASVLSAWGQSLARREQVEVSPIWRPLRQHYPELVARAQELIAARPELPEATVTVDLRHEGTDHALEVPLDLASLDDTIIDFKRSHRERFGFDRPQLAIEVVNLRVRCSEARPQPTRAEDDPWGLGEQVVTGPERVTTATTSIWVPEGWEARRQDGLLRLERVASQAARVDPLERTPFAVELWSRRFQAVAEEAGSVLQRLARSVNIRERLDFSCAIFDGRGRLVANAPHIPVHLGAMGDTVRDLLSQNPYPDPNQSWATNDPGAGGSHLPDITVITPVSAGDFRFFVACRAHHVDVGGLTPGSMPKSSKRLADEGFVLRREPLMAKGRMRPLSSLLFGCREPETVAADLEAQVAANAHAARRLLELGPPRTLAIWMKHLQDVAAEAAGEVIRSIEPGSASDELDGVPLQLAIRTFDGQLMVDLTGTGGPHTGNLNTPPAVVRAAVMFSMRVLMGQDMPLNEGVLRKVRFRLPSPSILAPPPDAAVAGGNVETSQRLVDLFLRAVGRRASSQGTMNNLTLGGEKPRAWSLYETVGGGQGATPEAPGLSGRQVHMTNTRATDPEALEARLPLRLRRFSIRPDSGGAGEHPGGDGLVRELEILVPTTASLLATARAEGRPGLGSGGAGAAAEDAIYQDGSWTTWDGETLTLSPGDRVRVATPGGGGWSP